MYSHALFISQLSFEDDHQLLEFSLSRTKNLHEHNYDTKLNLAIEWLALVGQNFQLLNNAIDEKRFCELNILFFLYGGSHVFKMKWNVPKSVQINSQVEDPLMSSLERVIFDFSSDWYVNARKSFK